MQTMQIVYSATSPRIQPAPPQRASAACQLCRTKKVRCDAREGKRCSNCAFDNTQCVLLPRKARKAPRANRRFIAGVSPPPKEATHSITAAAQEPASMPRYHDKEGMVTDSAATASELPENNCPRLQSGPLELSWAPGGPRQRHTYSHTSSSPSRFQPYQPSRPTIPALPEYIKPLPPSLGPDDIEYLQRKGAFTLIEPALRDDCLRRYVLHVHPLYPAVDHVKVQSIIHGSPVASNDRLSLLLLQAMIFSGSMWADVRLVRSAGFLSRKSLRQTLHQRIRFLYDADYEDDQPTLVQSLLLWSFWWKGQNQQKDSWHWLGTAHSIAGTLDFHHSTPESGPKSAAQRQHRRLWWALCTREVIGSFGMSRAPRIKDTDHDVSMLQLDDFSYDNCVTELCPNQPLPTEAQHVAMSRLTIEFVKLNQIFGRILAVACPENASGRTAVLCSTQQMEGTNSVLSRRQVNIKDLNLFEEELTEWCKQVPENLRHERPLPFDSSEWHKIELCHRGMLWMMCHMARMTIHRPQMLSSRSNTSSPTGRSERDCKGESQTAVRHAARMITEISMDFYRADLLACLSATVVSCLMPVSIHHTFDTFSEDATIRSEASRQLEECRAMLYTLAEQQFAPAWILQTVDHIMSQAKQHRNSRDPSQPAPRVSIGGSNQAAQTGIKSPANLNADDVDPISHTNDDARVASFGSNTESMPSAMAAIVLEQPIGLAQANPDLCQPEWLSLLDNSDPWQESQLSSLAEPPGPAIVNNFGALEEMWVDFAGLSEFSPSYAWKYGSS